MTADSVLQELARCLRRRCAAAAAVSDAQLLGRFAADGDEAAFELLVWRHGRMVLGVCRRALSREQDAGLAGPSCCSMLRRGAGSRASRWHPARTPCAYGTRRT